jgi:hypothetical protein
MRRRRNSAPAPHPGAACRLQRNVRRAGAVLPPTNKSACGDEPQISSVLPQQIDEPESVRSGACCRYHLASTTSISELGRCSSQRNRLRARSSIRLRPPIGPQCNASVRIEQNTFSFKQVTLDELAPWPCTPRADPTLVVDDPMPGHGRMLRQRVEGVADQSRMARHVREGCYVTICQHTSARDPANDSVDPVVAAIGLRTHPPAPPRCEGGTA